MHVEIDERANETRVSVPAGGSLVICLTEQPTTGFTWALVRAGEPACVPIDDRIEPAAGAVGGGGLHRWSFRAAAPGGGRIELAYRRAWQHNAPPARMFTIEVSVWSDDPARSGDEGDLPEI